MNRTCHHLTGVLFAAAVVFLTLPQVAHAHCDTMDGPVIADARKALETGNQNFALRWVRPDTEKEILQAFTLARKVRAQGAQAKELADRYFYETLVRVHRSGEGAPFTGIKPAGTPLDPAVSAADKAIATGTANALTQETADLATQEIQERFTEVMETRKHMNDNLDAGRRYVKAYVEFVHYVENLHAAMTGETAEEEHK